MANNNDEPKFEDFTWPTDGKVRGTHITELPKGSDFSSEDIEYFNHNSLGFYHQGLIYPVKVAYRTTILPQLKNLLDKKTYDKMYEEVKDQIQEIHKRKQEEKFRMIYDGIIQDSGLIRDKNLDELLK